MEFASTVVNEPTACSIGCDVYCSAGERGQIRDKGMTLGTQTSSQVELVQRVVYITC
jgi:hypothetical protein